MNCSTPGLHVPHHLPEFTQVQLSALVMPSRHLILWCPLFLLPSNFSSIRDFSNESSVRIRWPKYWSFSISPSSEYSGLISLNWLAWPPCCPRDFQESSPAQQLEGIDFFLEFFFLYSPAVTTIRDHWEDHRLDYVDLCWQSNVSAFQHTVYVCHHFPAEKRLSSDFTATVTIHSNFGAQEEEIYHYFCIFPFYLPCSNGTRGHDLSFIYLF